MHHDYHKYIFNRTKSILGGDLEDSIVAFTDAMENGTHPLHSHLNRGIAYFKIARFHHAIKDFDIVINENENHERALFYRGIAKLNLGKYVEAIHDFNRTITIKPERGNTYLARGLAHHFLGHTKKADKDIHNDHVLKSVEL